MKEVRTKLDIYVESEDKEAVYARITKLLEDNGLSYQIYEQEIQEY